MLNIFQIQLVKSPKRLDNQCNFQLCCLMSCCVKHDPCLWSYENECHFSLWEPKVIIFHARFHWVCCTAPKVRRVTKNVCKLHTKRVRLNKIAQHEKKYLLNCSVRIYRRIIKLKYLWHKFSCNKTMCLYKRQTHVSNYCKFQLSSDREKNPGPTPVYIAP